MKEKLKTIVVLVYGKLEMMMANKLHAIPKLLSSKKSSFDRDRFLPSNAASNFPYGKFSSVIQRNKTKKFFFINFRFVEFPQKTVKISFINPPKNTTKSKREKKL